MKVDFFKRKTINLDIGIRCTLLCPKCNRQRFSSAGKKVPGHDTTIKEFDMITDFFKIVSFCGQVSDPIFNPNFIEFLKIGYNKNVKCNVHTAASHKSEEWYIKAFKSNPNATWIFGIDGLPHTSHLHRINQDGEKLFKIMLLANKMVKSVTWQYIVFKYNEDDMNSARELAKKNNLKLEFMASSRFRENDPLMPKKQENYLVRSELWNDFYVTKKNRT